MVDGGTEQGVWLSPRRTDLLPILTLFLLLLASFDLNDGYVAFRLWTRGQGIVALQVQAPRQNINRTVPFISINFGHGKHQDEKCQQDGRQIGERYEPALATTHVSDVRRHCPPSTGTTRNTTSTTPGVPLFRPIVKLRDSTPAAIKDRPTTIARSAANSASPPPST